MIGRMLAAALIAGMLSGCGGGDASWWDHALSRMREQPRYDRYEASHFFADGKVLQSPPPGTIPRERVIGPDSLISGQRNGVFATALPIPATPELLARGQSRFGIYCAACHGAAGFGGSIVAANWPGRKPPSMHDSLISSMPAGQIFTVITDGFGRMPSYATELSPIDRWAVIGYIRELERKRTTVPGGREDSLRAARINGADSAGPPMQP
ncbi:MAG TPA: cytochrome c [Gemmatimonadales bacterium]|nr:cytochrome c [Gemmatimonadales bacterium]